MLGPVITLNTDNESDKPAPLEKGQKTGRGQSMAVDKKKEKVI